MQVNFRISATEINEIQVNLRIKTNQPVFQLFIRKSLARQTRALTRCHFSDNFPKDIILLRVHAHPARRAFLSHRTNLPMR